MKFIRLMGHVGAFSAGKVLWVSREISSFIAKDLLQSGWAVKANKAEWNAQLPKDRKREALKGI